MRFGYSILISIGLFGQHIHPTGPKAPAAATALPETGGYSFPIQTNATEAQKYFSAGMAMIYGFNHDEAQRLFRRAAELDAHSPMPQWGLALSLGSHINNDPEETREKHAWEAIARAKALAGQAPKHEQRYIDALEARYSPDQKKDRKQLARNYAAAMAALHRDYPDDPDAATLYAESLMNLNPWKYWSADGKPADGTAEFVAVLESVLRRWPGHPGANHYYIHAVEASPNPERALAAANRLGTLVPAAGHLVHMPSHIYARLGHWDPAATSNADAVAADLAFLKANPVEGLYPLMYYPHNIHFLLYARGAQGQCDAAAEAGHDLVKQVSPGLDAMPMLQGFIGYNHQLSVWCPSIPLGPAPAAKHALATVAYQYALATHEAWKKNIPAAKASQASMKKAAEAVAPETLYEPAYTAAYLTVAKESVAARIADAESNLAQAETHWRNAVEAQDRLRYDEPPMWFYQVRQSLGSVLLRAGKTAEAEAVLRESLTKQARDGRVLFLLWKTLEKAGRTRDAALIEAEFKATWKGGHLKVDEL